MSRHLIDLSKSYDRDKKLPKDQQIEDPKITPVPETDPKMQNVEREPYYPDKTLVGDVNLAIALGRPLLLQGHPGCGKTRLAHAVAFALKLPLEECYIKSTSSARDLLYTYDAVNRLYDAQLGKDSPKDENGNPRSRDIRNYIHFGPLGKAIIRAQYGRRSVVLIDEIDKADIDFPNDLLLEIDQMEFCVSEASDGMFFKVPEDKPELRPIVFVTHNEEKALPTAFLRRCIFHYIELPEDEQYFQDILKMHDKKDVNLNKKAIDVLIRLRKLDLLKKPGLSELLDWVGYLQAVEKPEDELEELPYIGVLLKDRMDQKRALKEFGSG
ncbi:MoxR family ATPase [Desulfobacterales bacterium HSG16]|nr:MoxR family ATPase [Desulfobacterales bacterium HSG16]